MHARSSYHFLHGFLPGALAVLLASCTSHRTMTADQPCTSTGSQSPQPPHVIRQGRYVLVESGPTAGQDDLLEQTVQIDIPGHLNANVGQALEYLLMRSGFRLCGATDNSAQLYRLPIPAVHLQLGPMPLRQALEILSGPAWLMDVNRSERRVCFSKRSLPQGGSVEGKQP